VTTERLQRIAADREMRHLIEGSSLGAPYRIQLRRTKGWRKPIDAVVVARPTRWGNPFRVGDVIHRGPLYSGHDEIVRDRAHAVRLYRQWLFTQEHSENLAVELRGRVLACWCPLDQPCHADVLLELANG
jgi:hypothetical protein